MPRGGKRTPTEGKKLGRPKAERPVNTSVALKILARAKAEQLWLDMIELEKSRLGLGDKYVRVVGGKIDGPDFQGRFSIIPLTNLLRYLEDRAYGRPMDTVNHLHNKPIEVNHTFSLSERIKRARERAAAHK